MATINLNAFPYSDEVACPKCKNIVTLYDPEGSEYIVCTSCHSFIRFIANDTLVIQKYAPPVNQQPVIRLGSVGFFRGYDFKVIGYIEKKEKAAGYAWREYILYNYEKGYANFAEYDGHWTFVAGKEFYPSLEKLSDRSWNFIEYEENEYNLFNKYTAMTTALIGEFDWDILFEQAKTSEFVAPPNIVYKEQDKPGTSTADFYLGKYAEPAEIAEAFKIDINLFPQKVGIGANQPSVHAKRWLAVGKIVPVLVILVALVGFAASVIKPELQVMDNDYFIVSDSTKVNEFKPFITPSFELKDNSSALDFLIKSDIDNNWLETTVVLVNEKNNQSWEVTESIEYYHGYEAGESWTEGSQEANVLLSDIPNGKYHLNIYPASGDTTNKNIHINILANPVIWRNVWVTILLLCLYPLYAWYRMRNYEKQRWMNSDYSPYEAEE
ncbi:DUF4178 domain-containing protein [Mucilaginibacter pocheonensis]|uniref:DUF4178 domain-containing protein n=1 Tax=Mucilaginibacter pocheonensis TaxID=398050 RepID=A0ABU1T8D7_9SPHI|nr:DUF4178 domain-containing protein [Mucilaginibacter pocheonensis]MDR6941554.1 hypothetical protein [Mucilaginibacter pocheonensis]